MAVHVASDLPIHPLSVDDVQRMVEAGILGEDDRVELIDGVLVEVSPQGPRHAHAVRRLIAMAVPAAAAAGLEVAPQVPVLVESRFSLPEPDLAITPPGTPDRHSAQAVLVVEVALSSLRFDLDRKARLYAEAGVPEYWVLDLAAGEMVVHRGPSPGGYADVRRASREEEVRAVALDLRVPVGALL